MSSSSSTPTTSRHVNSKRCNDQPSPANGGHSKRQRIDSLRYMSLKIAWTDEVNNADLEKLDQIHEDLEEFQEQVESCKKDLKWKARKKGLSYLGRDGVKCGYKNCKHTMDPKSNYAKRCLGNCTKDNSLKCVACLNACNDCGKVYFCSEEDCGSYSCDRCGTFPFCADCIRQCQSCHLMICQVGEDCNLQAIGFREDDNRYACPSCISPNR